MALPEFTAEATVIAKDGLKVDFTKGGKTRVALKLKFQQRIKQDDETWIDGDSLWVDATAIGATADNIVNDLELGHLDTVRFKLWGLHTERWEYNGKEYSALKAVVGNDDGDVEVVRRGPGSTAGQGNSSSSAKSADKGWAW